jgi:hypothetical protein
LETSEQPDIAAVPWYSDAAAYEAVRSWAADAEDFFADYQQWLRAAISHENAAHAKGVTLIRIRMVNEEFLDWVRRRGLNNDANSRSEFAYERACRIIGN